MLKVRKLAAGVGDLVLGVFSTSPPDEPHGVDGQAGL